MNLRIGNFFRELTYSLRRSPSLFIGNLMTIFISLLALGGGLVVGQAVDSATERWKDGVEFIVFLNPDASEIERQAVTGKLEVSEEIERFTFVNKEEAFDEFQRMFRDSEQIRSSVNSKLDNRLIERDERDLEFEDFLNELDQEDGE